MDITFLSKILRELILYNDRVSLPGLGSFVAEIVPSVFSDGGMVIHPPTRRISFRVSESWNDGILEGRYAEEQNISLDESADGFKALAEEIRVQLNSKKSYALPGFGTLRATDQNDYFFITDKDMLTYIESFGLESLNIKVLQQTGSIEQLEQGPCTGMSEREKEGTAAIDTGKILEVEYDGENEVTEGSLEGKEDSVMDVKPESPGAEGADPEKKTDEIEENEGAEAVEKEKIEEETGQLIDTPETEKKEEKEDVIEKDNTNDNHDNKTNVTVTPTIVTPNLGKEVKKKKPRKVLRAILIIVLLFLIALTILVVFKDELRPVWEWLLYSESEREILNM